jgi:hypothetical protein
VSDLEVGARVRCYPAHGDTGRGTWPRYAGRVGTVAVLNDRDGEVGVRFTSRHDEPTAWFTPDELQPRHLRSRVPGHTG